MVIVGYTISITDAVGQRLSIGTHMVWWESQDYFSEKSQTRVDAHQAATEHAELLHGFRPSQNALVVPLYTIVNG